VKSAAILLGKGDDVKWASRRGPRAPKCENRDSCLSRFSIPTTSHEIAGLKLAAAVVAVGSHIQERFEDWVVASSDLRKFAVRIASYPEVDLCAVPGMQLRPRSPSGCGLRWKTDGRLGDKHDHTVGCLLPTIVRSVPL